jgi:hypothetical protein
VKKLLFYLYFCSLLESDVLLDAKKVCILLSKTCFSIPYSEEVTLQQQQLWTKERLFGQTLEDF